MVQDVTDAGVTSYKESCDHVAQRKSVRLNIVPCLQGVAQVANLKGQPLSSFVTLSGRHTIFGHTSFSATIRATSLVAVTVDRVVITPQSVLVADDSQYLNGTYFPKIILVIISLYNMLG